MGPEDYFFPKWSSLLVRELEKRSLAFLLKCPAMYVICRNDEVDFDYMVAFSKINIVCLDDLD